MGGVEIKPVIESRPDGTIFWYSVALQISILLDFRTIYTVSAVVKPYNNCKFIKELFAKQYFLMDLTQFFTYFNLRSGNMC